MATPDDQLFISLRAESSTAIAKNLIDQNPILSTVKKLLDALTFDAIRNLIMELFSGLCNTNFYKKLFESLKNHIKNNPVQTAMFLIGVILMLNPIGLLGFGVLGPTSGSIAAGWMASYGGGVAAGSAYATLQSIGMTYNVIFPVIGVTLAVTGAATSNVARAAGKEINNWAKGDYGEPVKEWMEGKYGNAVADWWGGKFGNPVLDWFNAKAQGK